MPLAVSPVLLVVVVVVLFVPLFFFVSKIYYCVMSNFL